MLLAIAAMMDLMVNSTRAAKRTDFRLIICENNAYDSWKTIEHLVVILAFILIRGGYLKLIRGIKS
jgi:hypothetical protein